MGAAATRFALTAQECAEGRRAILRRQPTCGRAGTDRVVGNARQGNFVLRRGFASPDDEARFRSLAAAHLRTSGRA